MESFEGLLGKTIVSIVGAKSGSDRIEMELSNGDKYILYHAQQCCEGVEVEDVIGDISDLLNSPITMAEESTSDQNPDGITKYHQYSFTWTFYKLATVKGYVTIRWYGESNGCYSESVDFQKAYTAPSNQQMI
jgi:hypothetical protein